MRYQTLVSAVIEAKRRNHEWRRSQKHAVVEFASAHGSQFRVYSSQRFHHSHIHVGESPRLVATVLKDNYVVWHETIKPNYSEIPNG